MKKSNKTAGKTATEKNTRTTRANVRLMQNYASADGVQQTPRPIPAGLEGLKKGIRRVSERPLLEDIGRKVTLIVDRLAALDVPRTEQRADGTSEQVSETMFFFVMKRPGGVKEYYFNISSRATLDTLTACGLLPEPEETTDGVAACDVSFEELLDCCGKSVSGYFYFTAENGGGKKLFPDPESLERYAAAIQARYEKTIQNAADLPPADAEKVQ